MKEICVLFLFVLANFASSASVKNNNDILESLQKTDLSQSELDFFANISTILANEGRNKQTRKRIKDLFKRPQIAPVSSVPAQANPSRLPCECKKGICSCCLGGFFFNNKGCMNIRYLPEDFAFELKMTLNENVLYKNTMSGKNPRPICISPPRFGQWIEMCAKFHDIYFIGRNMHLCLDISATVGEFDLVDREFDCMKFGSDGVALVSPEEGGAHPGYPPVISAGTDAEVDSGGPDTIEDYDENVG